MLSKEFFLVGKNIILAAGSLILALSCFFPSIAYCREVAAISPENNIRILPFKHVINIGNALDAPKDIFWGVEFKDEYFATVKKAGFDGVRLPVRFSDYVVDGKLDENFMKKIDKHIEAGLNQGLYIILDFHHFNEIMDKPVENRHLLLQIWQQLSVRYSKYSDKLVFEILNEPQKNLTADLWNEYLAGAVKIIRQNNPKRYIIIGAGSYNNIADLKKLILPKTDNLIVTFHYYEPPEFTFQDNPYLGYEQYKNIKWQSSFSERLKIARDFLQVKQWAIDNKVPVFLGEFGVNKNVPENMRVLWTECVRKEAEQDDFSWGYWEFGSAFGIYDLNKNEWDKALLQALLAKEKNS